MKLTMKIWEHHVVRSLPVQGAWIEINGACPKVGAIPSLPVQGAWIEIRGRLQVLVPAKSLPVQGAWIEIG